MPCDILPWNALPWLRPDIAGQSVTASGMGRALPWLKELLDTCAIRVVVALGRESQ
jgi:uracil-DNA glycosylase